MLEIRPNCEHCGKALPNTALDAMICSFECTYCRNCALDVFENVCPSCSGNFQARPIRPAKMAKRYPPSETRVFEPKDLEKLKHLIRKNRQLLPEQR